MQLRAALREAGRRAARAVPMPPAVAAEAVRAGPLWSGSGGIFGDVPTGGIAAATARLIAAAEAR